MPHFSYANEFSGAGGDGPIVATAFSAGCLDGVQARDWGAGEPIKAYARITQAFNNMTSVNIDVGGADDAVGTNFTSYIGGGQTILLAAALINTLVSLGYINAGRTKKRFLIAKYTIVGTAPTTGKITCGLIDRDAAVQDGINTL